MKKTYLILVIIIVLAGILRLWKINSLPALNADEAALGYNAYSLLLTGKDEHGNSWPVHFQSFNDFKPGLYVYLAIPFIKLFGLTESAVRLPGIILSISTVAVVFFLVKELFTDEKHALISALFLAISPWHIHFSRGAWEVSVATFFITCGLLFLFKGLTKKHYYLFAAIMFILGLYTYHAARIVIPLLGFGFVVIQNRRLIKNIRLLSLVAILSLILLFPLAKDLMGEAGISRVAGVGLFADTGPISRINEQRGQHGDFKGIIAKLIHNKFVNYGLAFVDNWGMHFNGEFLFLSGDEIQRNRVPETGQMYLVDLIFLVTGLILISRQGKNWGIIIWWLIIAPVAAALTFQSPHALRAHNMVIPLVIISSFGMTGIMKYFGEFKWKRLAYISVIFVTVWGFARYLHMYYVHMAKEYSFSSQNGAKEMVNYVFSKEKDYQKIIITDRYDQPYILYLFYTKYDPFLFQKEHTLSARDQYGFSTVRQFNKFHFISINFDVTKPENPNSLLVGTGEEIPDEANIIKKVYFPNGEPAYEIVAN